MSGVADFAKDLVGSITGSSGEKAATQAAGTQAAAQQAALDYLKEQEAIPQLYREQALSMLGGLYGLQPQGVAPSRIGARTQEVPMQGGFFSGTIDRARGIADQAAAMEGQGGEFSPMSSSSALSSIMASPVYQAALGDIGEQEESILRSQAATGALRGSGTELMLAENQRRNRLNALQTAMGGVQGLAGLQSYAPQIAQGMAGIGQTLAQGQVAGAQARQAGISNTLGLGMNALSLAGFSDIRLKDDIKPAGRRYGQDWFTWTWNAAANALGMFGNDEGVIADKVKETRPDLVGERAGYLTVNYQELANG